MSRTFILHNNNNNAKRFLKKTGKKEIVQY